MKSKLTILLVLISLLSMPFALAKPKKLNPAPKKITVSVSQIPSGQVALVAPLTFDKTLIEISEAMSNVSGALTVFSQDGVGVIQTNGNLPSSLNFVITFKGLKRGKTDITTGEVVDKIGGTPISGATAESKTKKIKVK